MSKIVFRGKTYNSVLEMPNDVRVAFQIEKRQRSAENNTTEPIADFMKAPDAVRKFYEHTPENVEGGSASSGNQNRSSHLPPPPAHPVIEPDNSTRRLAVTLVVFILLAGIAFAVMQYVN